MTQDSSGTYTWTKSFPANSEITSVLVAPPIDASNPYQKGIDYAGQYGTSLDSSTCLDYVLVNFRSPGVYAVEVTFANAPTYLEFLWAGAEEAYDVQGVENGRPTQIPTLTPSPGAFTIEQPIWEVGNPGFDATAALIVPNSVRTVSVQDAMTKLNTAFNNNGGPIGAVMVGHGNTSEINVGKRQFAQFNVSDGLYLLDNNQWVQNFCNGVNGVPGLQGKISILFLLTCDVAQNYPNNPNHLMSSLANGLHQAGGVGVQVSGYDKEVWGVLSGPTRPGYFCVGADATLVTVTVG